jgi:hypothetical protein
MSGPFHLRYLHLFVKEKSAGVFILSRNGRTADFVGASSDDLVFAVQDRAKDSTYRYFWYAYTRSADDAYEMEHALRHRYRPTDNSSPAPNPRSNWHCTTEGCAACALTAIK